MTFFVCRRTLFGGGGSPNGVRRYVTDAVFRRTGFGGTVRRRWFAERGSVVRYGGGGSPNGVRRYVTDAVFRRTGFGGTLRRRGFAERGSAVRYGRGAAARSIRRAARLLIPTPNNTIEIELIGISTAATNGDSEPLTPKLKPMEL